MPEQPIVFKRPPAREVQLGVQFSNTLEVADNRSKFHGMVAREFPVIIMPERNKLTFDFGDYATFTENLSDRLEIGMSYFRLVTTRYRGFDTFKRLFFGCLSMFCECYGIRSFGGLAMQYVNELPIPPEGGFKQSDLFSIDVLLPEGLGPLTVVRASLMFEKPEGLVAVELDPQLTENKITSYKMQLVFAVQRTLPFDRSPEDLEQLVATGHGYLKRFFFSLLRKDYIERLRTL